MEIYFKTSNNSKNFKAIFPVISNKEISEWKSMLSMIAPGVIFIEERMINA